MRILCIGKSGPWPLHGRPDPTDFILGSGHEPQLASASRLSLSFLKTHADPLLMIFKRRGVAIQSRKRDDHNIVCGLVEKGAEVPRGDTAIHQLAEVPHMAH